MIFLWLQFISLIVFRFFLKGLKIKRQNEEKIFAVFAFLNLSIVMGLRGYDVGTDTIRYATWFVNRTYNYEFSYNLVTDFVRFLTSNASVYLYRTNSSSYYGGTVTISVNVAGQNKSTTVYPSYPTNIGTGTGNAHKMATFSYTVIHNSDGSKTASINMSWSANFNPTSGSASGNLPLTNLTDKFSRELFVKDFLQIDYLRLIWRYC